MARLRLRTVLWWVAGLLAALVLLVAWFWPGPTYRTEVVVRERFREVAPPTGPAPRAWAPPPPRVLRVEEAPRPLQRRLAWAHERAAWIDGGWVVCDVAGLAPPDANLAQLVRDERGWLGPVDPASSSMLVVDGWLALAVTEPAGSAEVELGAFLTSETRVWVSWTDAVGEVPGRCLAQAGREAAVVAAWVVAADGVPEAGPGEIVEVVGCGYTTSAGPRPARAEGPCVLRAIRRGALLPTQVSAGPPVTVVPAKGEVVEVTLPLPPDPSGDLPRLDETLLLLDVAAFSGAEVLADHVEVVLDDLEAGEVDLEHFAGFREADTDDSAETPDDVFEVIASTWHAWGALDE